MYRVALVENGLVTNVFVADTTDAVQSLPLFLEGSIAESSEFILESDETGKALIGGKYINGKFSLPSPYPSWVFDEEAMVWNAPVPIPQYLDNQYPSWDEESQSWNILDIPIPVPDPE